MYPKLISIFALCILGAVSSPIAQDDTSGNRVYPACLIDGNRVQVGQRAKQGQFVYECQQNGDTVKVVPVACLDDSGNEHKVGDRWDVGTNRPFKYTMECKMVDGVPTREVVQCFYDSDDGQARLDPGQEQKVGKTTVRCEKMGELGVRYNNQYDNGAVASSNVVSADRSSSSSSSNSGSSNGGTGGSITADQYCVMGGERIEANQRARIGGFVYKCQPDDSGSVRAVIDACLDKDKQEHQVGGDRWEEDVEGGTNSQSTLRYAFECVKHDGITTKRVAQCVYNGAKIDVGSQQVVGKSVVHCNKMGTNGGIVSIDSGTNNGNQ